MQNLLFQLGKFFLQGFQLLPLTWVARIGRLGGHLTFLLFRKHRQIAIDNLTRVFGTTHSTEEIHAIARENLSRIGEAYACAIKTTSMPEKKLFSRLEVLGVEQLQKRNPDASNAIIAIGHFANFEVYARAATVAGNFRAATTYRGLKPPFADRLLRWLREQSGCLFFERRTQANELKRELASGGVLLGLLSDQHAGNGGIRGPFFGVDCSTTSAPAVLALRYNAPLFTAICYRTSLARWRVEIGPPIPLKDENGVRSVEQITQDINLAFEKGIRRDPANWFWVHRRWKPAPAGKKREQAIA
ncbi:MAG: hypothetical protein SFY81_11580 [Verrucomicrobiota bacterium]|nr:hypothetical protein [Verrucomicrobiota bacterium]